MRIYPTRVSRTRFYLVADPGLNTFMEVTVPSGVLWRIQACYYLMKTQPIIGDAKASILITSPTSATAWEWDSGLAVGAGAFDYVYGTLGGGYYTNTIEQSESFSLPDLWLYPGYILTMGYYGETGDMELIAGRVTVDEQILGY